MADSTETWAAFLNPEVVRPKLIAAGLFLLGHEMLIDSIKRHPLEFFSNHWTAAGPQPSAKYQAKVLALDPKGKNDPFRGSIAWLRQEDVITAEDEVTIRSITDARNKLAHEMLALFSTSDMPQFMDHFPTLLGLVQKIEKWWIVKVELPANPDYDGREVDEDGIVSGPSWIMQLLTQVALGDDKQAWEFYELFMQWREKTVQ